MPRLHDISAVVSGFCADSELSLTSACSQRDQRTRHLTKTAGDHGSEMELKLQHSPRLA